MYENKEMEIESLDLESKTYNLDSEFGEENHDSLIEFLKNFTFTGTQNIYLAPSEHLIDEKVLKMVDGKMETKTYKISKYSFESKEAKEFTIPVKYALISGVVRQALSNDMKAQSIPFEKVNSKTLLKIFEYMNHVKGIPIRLPPFVEKSEKAKKTKNMKKLV